MAGIRVLVTHEYDSYREVFADAFLRYRPGAQVIEVEPDELDREVLRQRPHLVVCSRLSETVQTRVLGWVLLYPEGKNLAVVSVAGESVTLPDIKLAELLSVLDRVELIASPD